ncbi:MAG: WG repeat-containing protein [Opitutales bacterium]|nr:WG repeat-containing protein [Opitutales bacterium]
MMIKYSLTFLSIALAPLLLSSEFFPATVDGDKWGYIDVTGEFVIEPEFQRVEAFVDGLAIVSIGKEKTGVIDVKGELLHQVRYSQLQNMGCDLVGITDRRGRVRVLDVRNKEIIGEYATVGSCRNGLFPYQKTAEGLWGFSDRFGEILIPPKYTEAFSFHEERALVYEGKPDYWLNEIMPIGDGYKFLDPEGETFAVDGKFAGEFSGGLAPVWKEGEHGYIDKEGVMVIEPSSSFTIPLGFSEGIGISYQSRNRIKFYDAKGRKLFHKEGLRALPFSGDSSAYFNGESWIVINPQGEELFFLTGGALRLMGGGVVLHLPDLSSNSFGDPFHANSYAYWKEGKILQSFNYDQEMDPRP